MGKHIVTAVIPVRAGSVRLPNKNILPFGRSNLLIHKIHQLRLTPEIDNVLVSSDSDEMLAMAEREGALVQKRPWEYCDEKTKSFGEVVAYVAGNAPGDTIMWAPCVCPLVGATLFTMAINNYLDLVINQKSHDSLISVRVFKEYLWDDKGPVNYKLGLGHVPSQQLPDWQVVINGFYLAPREKMVEWNYFFGMNPYRMEVPKINAPDIDDRSDFEVARALLNFQAQS